MAFHSSDKDVPIQIRAEGHVTPFAAVAIKSRVDGELERALFNEGHELKRGEPILVIDSRIPESALRQAEANLLRDEAACHKRGDGSASKRSSLQGRHRACRTGGTNPRWG